MLTTVSCTSVHPSPASKRLSISSQPVWTTSMHGWELAGSDSTHPRQKLCGWVQVSNCSDLTSPRSTFCPQMSGSLRPLVISELLSTVSCQCLHTLPLCAELVIISFVNMRPVVRSLSADATTMMVQAFISFCLDYCNSLLYGISDGLLQTVVSTERRCMSGHGRSKVRPCDAHTAPVTLAAGATAHRVQGHRFRLPVFDWPGPVYLDDSYNSALHSKLCCRAVKNYPLIIVLLLFYFFYILSDCTTALFCPTAENVWEQLPLLPPNSPMSIVCY